MRRATAILFVWLAAVSALGETARPRTDLNLRKAPKVRKSNVIAVLGPADTVEILETSGEWCRVRVVSSGAEGWVSKKYIEAVPDVPAPAVQSATGGGMATIVVGLLIAALLAAIGYAAGHQSVTDAASGTRNAIPMFVVSLVIGTFYVGLTLPKALITLGTEREWLTVARLGEWSLSFNQRLSGGVADFPSLMRYILWAILLYLASLLLLAIRHGQFNLFGWGAATLTISSAILHLIVWVGYIIAKMVMFFAWLFSTIGGFLLSVLGKIVIFFASLVMDYWWVVLPGLAIVLVVTAFRSKFNLGEMFKTLGGLVLALSGMFVVAALLRWIWQFIGVWVLAVLKFVGMLLLRLLLGIALLLGVAMVGQLLLDQIHGALSAGRRRRGVIIGAIAIGTSIAILTFVSNLYGVSTWLPAPAMEFAGKYLHQPAPLLDALIALGIVALSIVGVWRNVPALGKEPTMQEFGKSLVYTIAGVFVAGALVALAGDTEA